MTHDPDGESDRTDSTEPGNEWERLSVTGGGRLSSVLALPAVASGSTQSAVRYVLPESPLLATDADGDPKLSLTLLLSRQPRPDEDSIGPLVERAILRFDATLAIGADVIEALACEYADAFEPLFATGVDFELIVAATDERRTLASTEVTGSNASGSLGATLDRSDALAVLDALDGDESPLSVAATVSYNQPEDEKTIRIRAQWARLWDVFERMAPADGMFSRADLRVAFEDAIDAGEIDVTVDGGTVSEVRDAAFNVFLSHADLILRHRYDAAESGPTYALAQRPREELTLDLNQTIRTPAENEITLERSLTDILEGVRNTETPDAYISLVALGTDGSGVGPVPDRSVARSASAVRGDNTPVALAMTGREVASVGRLVAPFGSVSPIPRKLIQERPHASYVIAEEVRIPPKKDRLEKEIPIVDSIDSPLWKDSQDPNTRWYLPEFVPVDPDPTDSPETAPFSFEFERHGTTQSGDPALRGSVRFELEERMPDNVVAALKAAGNPPVKSVPISEQRVTLEIPFVGEDGETDTHSFSASVTQTADRLVATVNMQNDWVRLCYGALAFPEFQERPPTVQVFSRFGAYQPIQRRALHLTAGNKRAITPRVVGDAAEHRDGLTYFDADTATLRSQTGDVRFKRTMDDASQPGSRSRSGRPSVSVVNSGLLTRPLVATDRRPWVSELAFRPDIEVAKFETVVNDPEYLLTVIGDTQRHDLSYPCADFTSLYRERDGDELNAIGCQDALKLGQTDYRQYEELSALRTDRYRVYQSLSQPDRFLVVPSTYRIARRAPEAVRGYEPSAMVYSVLDPEQPASSKIVFEAGLQPDIPEYVRRELRETLTARASDPVLEYPTDIFDSATYTWTTDRSIQSPTVVETTDHLRVSLTTDLVNGHLLRQLLETSGVFGRATFELADETSVSSGVALELDAIFGPWAGGPIEIDRIAKDMRLTNRAGIPIAVPELRAYGDTALLESIPVERTLQPSESVLVGTPAADGEHVAEYREQPGGPITLEESRVYVEDVTTNVIFVVQFELDDATETTVDVNARLRGLEGTHNVTLQGAPPSGSIEFTLPLFRYLDDHILEYQVTIRTPDKTTQTNWLVWDLRQQGSIVGLTPDILAQARSANRSGSKESDINRSRDRSVARVIDRPPRGRDTDARPDIESSRGVLKDVLAREGSVASRRRSRSDTTNEQTRNDDEQRNADKRD